MSTVQKGLFALMLFGLGSVATLAGTAVANDPGTRGKGAMLDKLVEDLQLDATQLAKGQEVKARILQRMKDVREERAAGLDELARQLAEGQVDRRAIHKLADRRLDAMSENIHASIDDVLDFVDTLDPQQKETLVNDLRTLQSASGSRRPTRAVTPE
jgi:hypothetical protein